MRRVVDLFSPAIGASGTVIAYGHWGRPVLVFPSEAGRAGDFEATAWSTRSPTCSTPGGSSSTASTLRRARRGRTAASRWRSGRGGTAPTSRGSSTRWCRSSTDDCGGPLGHRSPPALRMGAFHAAELRPPPRRPLPAGAVPVRQLRPDAPGTAGVSRATRSTSTTRRPTSPTCTATTWTGCAAAVHRCWSAARASGRTPPARSSRPARWPGCWPARASRTSWTCGAMTWRTTGRPGGPARPPPARDSADVREEAECPTRNISSGCCSAPRRTGRGLRDAAAPARAGHRRGRHHPHATTRADHHRAVQPARPAPPRAGHRPAGVLVLPPARVAEEGRADGRRVPAQQPVHVPVHGEARRLLRDDAPRAEGARDRARAVQEPARQRPVGLHRGPVQPAVRPGRGRRAGWATRCS